MGALSTMKFRKARILLGSLDRYQQKWPLHIVGSLLHDKLNAHAIKCNDVLLATRPVTYSPGPTQSGIVICTMQHCYSNQEICYINSTKLYLGQCRISTTNNFLPNTKDNLKLEITFP